MLLSQQSTTTVLYRLLRFQHSANEQFPAAKSPVDNLSQSWPLYLQDQLHVYTLWKEPKGTRRNLKEPTAPSTSAGPPVAPDGTGRGS